MDETILIVDDEESVRRTFQEWLTSSGLHCEVHAVGGAEDALLFANEHPIDLAILDWNLGTGSDGLQLLEDLAEFSPDVVAILVTGYAHQATPLQALRRGVRDYLDKNFDLDRETFLAAVRRQLDHIRPARRERQLRRSLKAFRDTVEQVLPLVQSAAALNEPVPLPEAIRSLFGFLRRTTHAADGVLLVRHAAPDGAETYLAYSDEGDLLPPPTVPFARSLAASVVSLGEPCAMSPVDPTGFGAVELQPFERNRSSLLAAPLPVGNGTHVVLELFDKRARDGGGFTDEDRRLAGAAADFGTALLRQALAERQTHRLLLDAVESALEASRSVAESMPAGENQGLDRPPPARVLDELREGLGATSNAVVDAGPTLRLAEAIRVLALRHGPPAVEHCTRLVESLRQLLDTISGAEEA